MARQSASLSATAMALAVFAAAAMAITAAPAAAMAITDAASIRPDQKVDFSELGADEQYATLGFDLADLQPEPPSGGRQRRASISRPRISSYTHRSFSTLPSLVYRAPASTSRSRRGGRCHTTPLTSTCSLPALLAEVSSRGMF